MRFRLLSLGLLAIGASACATESAATASQDHVSAVNPPPRPEPVKPPPAPKEAAGLPSLDFGPIYYELDSATLRAESRERLEQMAGALRQRREERD